MVKRLVGGLVLPSRKTFRQCVDQFIPSDALYELYVSSSYTGNGLWVVQYLYGGIPNHASGYYNERTSALIPGVVPAGC